jgi:hypothetical protein
MSLPPDGRGLKEEHITALEPLYTEVCKAHDAITDFRGKLLALVPALSGAAFALIATRKNFDQRLLLPVGIFGATVIFGLFVYELRGILLCHELRDRGGKLEEEMLKPKADAVLEIQGHFLNRTEKHKWRAPFRLLKCYWGISVPTASFVVYCAVILGWLVVAGFGVAGFFSTPNA